MEERKPSSLSLHPIRRVVGSTKLTDSINRSEFLPGSVECFSSASSGGYVKDEPVIDSTDYTGEESEAGLNRSDDTEEGTEWKIAYGMTKEEKDRLSNMKEEEAEEEGTVEWQSVKMERDDGLKYCEGLGRGQEKERDVHQSNGATDETCQTHRCERNRVKSEYGQQEGAELSTLATSCLLNQPRVLICRLKITDVSVSISTPPPHPMASTEDWRVKVPHSQHELSALKGSCSLRQNGQVMTWKRKMIGQLKGLQKQLPASSENGMCEASHNPLVISPRNKNTGQTVEASSPLFGCSKCPFVHTEKVNLHQHIENVHPEELRGTRVSEGSGGEKLSKNRTHEPPETLPAAKQSRKGSSGAHKCSHCGLCFIHISTLITHQRIHTGELPYHCSECGKSFRWSPAFKEHQRIHKGERPYHCSQCGKDFIRLENLRVHQRTHTGERPYHCTHCGKKFVQFFSLQVHQRTHTGERPYHCAQCGRKFGHLTSLQVHQQSHTEERPYPCSQCGKNFKSKSNLKVHQRTHTGERPYVCTQCGRNFGHTSCLQVHQLSHTEERPYTCSQCGKNFKSKPNLRNHQRTQTGGRCTTAPRGGRSSGNFKT